MSGPAARPSGPRPSVPGVVAVAAVLLLLAPWVAPAGAEENEAAAAKGADAEPKASILDHIRAHERDYGPLVEAARLYFDGEHEPWEGRIPLLAELGRHATEGRRILADQEALRWLVYQGRAFEPPLDDRRWQRSQNADGKGLGGTLAYVRAPGLTMVYSVPRKYKAKDVAKDYPRREPLPLLVGMHEKRDDRDKYPGQVLLERIYPPRADAYEVLYDEWLMVVPTAGAGNFVGAGGQVRGAVFQQPFAEFWRHYHVDFDRIVLDGSDQAPDVLAAMPMYFAGAVLRGTWTLTDAHKALVGNYANVPLYVVDNAALAAELREAGHPDVTAGIGGPKLVGWMQERRKVIPKSFTWQMHHHGHGLAQWINIARANLDAPERRLDVEIVDTEKDPNTVRIDAVGVDDLGVFLGDCLVDLDRPVRVVVNGHVEFEGSLVPTQKEKAPLGRDPDLLLNTDPVKIRDSMFFGFLFPGRVVGLQVRPPKAAAPAADGEGEKPAGEPAAAASEAQEAEAEQLMVRARHFHKEGAIDRAIQELRKVLDLPENSQTGEARKLLEEFQQDDAGTTK